MFELIDRGWLKSISEPPLPISLLRVLGSLLSAHLLIQDPEEPFGPLSPQHYTGELLELAHDLASRLLPAFENTSTGIPHARVSVIALWNPLSTCPELKRYLTRIQTHSAQKDSEQILLSIEAQLCTRTCR